jgi:hypothetical protein
LYLVLRSHQGEPSAVLHAYLPFPCFLLPEFIGFAVHPPHPFFGRVTSTIQCGFLRGDAEAIKVFQSFALLGEKSLVPSGQLFAS